MGDRHWMGTALLRPYTANLMQVTVPQSVVERYGFETGNRLWVELLDDGFALRIKGPLRQVNPPKGKTK